MQNIVLVIHLILALCLIGVVLLQRSEGGGLGMGGGGGGLVSSRGAATALGKLTWAFAIAFIVTSLTLTIFAAEKAGDSSVLDRIGVPGASQTEDGGIDLLPPAPTDLLPPAEGGETPATPPRAD